jgi:hypothetical protein
MTDIEDLPSYLTVVEAAEVLRIGRTKAYALAREWRATGGRSGLPVVDLGDVLRVPRCQLEAMIGGPLGDPHAITAPSVAPHASVRDEVPVEPEVVQPVARTEPVTPPPSPSPRPRTRRATSRDHRNTNTQLSFSELDLND